MTSKCSALEFFRLRCVDVGFFAYSFDPRSIVSGEFRGGEGLGLNVGKLGYEEGWNMKAPSHSQSLFLWRWKIASSIVNCPWKSPTVPTSFQYVLSRLFRSYLTSAGSTKSPLGNGTLMKTV